MKAEFFSELASALSNGFDSYGIYLILKIYFHLDLWRTLENTDFQAQKYREAQ